MRSNDGMRTPSNAVDWDQLRVDWISENATLSPVHTSNNVEAIGNIVEATFDFVEATLDFCCQKRQQCQTSIVKFRPFDKVETN